MPKFIGTPKEFKRYIGPFARNLVQQVSKKHKFSTNKCEKCGSNSNLEAAHKEGEDRNKIIDSILSRFLTDGVCELEMDIFENEFRDYHKNIEETIIVLCNSCHKEYDAKQKIFLRTEFNSQNSIIVEISKKTTNKSNDREFTNSDIQKRISKVAMNLPVNELELLIDKDYSKRVFNLNFPLFVRVREKADDLTKKEIIKDHSNMNRWTWKFQFVRNGYVYAISTQWYSWNDEYVKSWFKKYESPKVQV